MSEPLPTAGADDFPRRVTPEILDELAASDPRAQRSRADLRRINRIMAAVTLLKRGFAVAAPARRRALVELGAGDGTLALRLARSLGHGWLGTHLTLLDLEPSVAPKTADAIRACGWTLDVVAADALDWLAAAPDRVGVVFANLFVHHFEGERLVRLLGGIAARADAFVCCEPRRSRFALAGSRLLGLLGCNDVTRHDAVVSVQAGFRGREIGAAWRGAAAERGWALSEAAAGAFSHLFVAKRDE